MNDINDPLTDSYDADDAALREHRREAAKVTRIALLFAIPFVLMLIAVVGAFIWSSQRDAAGAARLAQGQTAAPSSSPVQTPVNDKDAEIARLRSQIAALQQGDTTPASPAIPGPTTYADPNALAQLSARLDKVEANQRVLARAAAAANAAAGLQQAAHGDSPFASQLAVVETSVDDPALIALLRPHAEKGVPSEVSLAVEFPQYAARANIAATSAANKNGLLEQVARMLNISVRRTDGEDQGPAGLLHSAEARLNVGDLRGAVAYLNRLPAPALAALKPWLDKAQARISVDDAIHRLTESALARLSQSGETATTPQTGGVL
ncbi:hypothetical protein ABI_13530 [Asticcacaulis biprosthecium C19]|uniref:Uncharacterized protein n=1 Tax=Asticcacaulis biprosthecium C19 TaxID=715226 RepID=F4QI47_9CAUL|nr:hypothetical protein [Asticcacaulis biprosthecium]EGF92914.1 hypothetical protein ABI_13530 [Asticcacaulis biprosthecium C19]